MRKQYHFRRSERGLMAWDVDRLITLTKDFPRINFPLSSIRELDESFWFGEGNTLTCRAVVEHARLMKAANLRFPIILSFDLPLTRNRITSACVLTNFRIDIGVNEVRGLSEIDAHPPTLGGYLHW